MEKFCDRCMTASPIPRQRVWCVDGKVFCSPECQAYLDEIKASRLRKYEAFIAPYLKEKARADAIRKKFDNDNWWC